MPSRHRFDDMDDDYWPDQPAKVVPVTRAQWRAHYRANPRGHDYYNDIGQPITVGRDVIPITPSLVIPLIASGTRVPITCSSWLLSPRFGFNRTLTIESYTPSSWHHIPLLPSYVPLPRVTGTGNTSLAAIKAARRLESRVMAYPPSRVIGMNQQCNDYIKSYRSDRTTNIAKYVEHLTRIAAGHNNHMIWYSRVEVYAPGGYTGGYIKPYEYDYDDWIVQYRTYLGYFRSDPSIIKLSGQMYYYRVTPIRIDKDTDPLPAVSPVEQLDSMRSRDDDGGANNDSDGTVTGAIV